MWQIKKERLRPMYCFTKTAHEFADYDLLIKSGLKPNTPSDPSEKNPERCQPWPPTRPCRSRIHIRRARRSRPTMGNLKQHDAGQQKCIDNWAFNQHRRGEKNEDVNLIAQFPFASYADSLPDQ